MWLKYVEQVGYDKLLFRREDFQAPAQSPLYYDLMQLGNGDLRSSPKSCSASGRRAMEDVPPLGQLANSYAEVERLLDEQQWEAAVDLLNRRGHFRDAPARLQPLIYQAYEHVCRQQAWAKFAEDSRRRRASRSTGNWSKAWNESLFANFPPAEQQRARVVEARQRVQLLGPPAASHPADGGQDQLVGRKGAGGDRGRACRKAIARPARPRRAGLRGG